jgi:putative tryptophan/tyrosine transport system substrate-binding protein
MQQMPHRFVRDLIFLPSELRDGGRRVRRRDFIFLLGSGAAAWPRATPAQQVDRKKRIGVLMSTHADDPEQQANVAIFLTSLKRFGWSPGQDVSIDYRWGEGEPASMEAFASELVDQFSDVLLAQGASVPAMHRATSTIPIVFLLMGDAPAQNYVGSFARPNGNMTGFFSDERSLVGKRLELLKQISPAISRVALIRDARGLSQGQLVRLVEVAQTLGVRVIDAPVQDDWQVESRIASLAGEPDGGLIIAFDAFTTVHRKRIVEIAVRCQLPAIYPFGFFCAIGGLLSYGVDQKEQFRQAASYVDRLLRGEKPNNLPAQALPKFELVINLKTAKALVLTVPPIMLARADEVIQ